MHLRKAGVSFRPEGPKQGCGGSLHCWGAWDNQPLPGTPGWGKEQRSGKGTAIFFLTRFKKQAGSFLGTTLSLFLFLHGSYVESQSQIYMFKDPFSPDHTQKLEDEWLRYFKENCKNPKMVRAFFSLLVDMFIIYPLYKLEQDIQMPRDIQN